MSAPTLKDQLLALCDEHDLRHISIAVYTLDDGTRFFGAAAHGGSFCGSNNSDGDDPASALSLAIADLNGKRAAAPVIAELVAA